MAQYGFCGGAAKAANAACLFWQWAWPEGCRILPLRAPAPRASRENTLGLQDTGNQPWWELKRLLELPPPALSPAQTRPRVSICSPKCGYCSGGNQAGEVQALEEQEGGRGRALGNSQTTAPGPTGRTRLRVSRDAHPGAGAMGAGWSILREQRPRRLPPSLDTV